MKQIIKKNNDYYELKVQSRWSSMYLNEPSSTVLKAINSFDFNLVQVLIDRVDDPSVNHVVIWASSFNIYYSIMMIMIKSQ